MLPSVPANGKACPECRASLTERARKCRCGWTVASISSGPSEAVTSLPQQDVPLEERRRIKGLIHARAAELAKQPPKDWRAHWKAIEANPASTVAAKLMAEEAIATLSGKRMSYLMRKGRSRIPGEDDDEIAA